MLNKNCNYWKEYEAISGPVTYCALAAFNKPIGAGYLASIGCTEEKRKACKRNMKLNGGFGLTPVETPGKKEAAVAAAVIKTSKGVEKMKTRTACPNWNEYEGLNGAVMFCSAGAYGRKLSAVEAADCGCNEREKEKCLKAMITHNGYGLVPEIEKVALVEGEKAERELVLGLF